MQITDRGLDSLLACLDSPSMVLVPLASVSLSLPEGSFKENQTMLRYILPKTLKAGVWG